MKQKLVLLRKRLLVLLKDKERKGLLIILWEAIMFWIVKKELPYFYFGKFLYRKDVRNYKDYLSSAEVDKITLSKNLHHYQYSSLLRNKLAFALFMEKNNMPVPSMIGYNLGNNFFLKNKNYSISDKNELYKYFNDLFTINNSTEVFIKAIAEMGGTGCYLITHQTLKSDIDSYGDSILTGDYIFQEVVKQHDLINTIYADSINTIRFDTYIDKNKNIHILSAFMRFGQGGSFIDNGSAGGFYLSVNMEKGTLIGCSHQLMKYGGERLDAHPDTGIVFEGYKIPYFTESCELIRKAVSLIPDRIIGWDIAISKDGPLIIEGNDNNSFVTPDIAYGGYLKHPMFKEIMQEA
ncbi:sugar-transfer associated ATP-grasp domain-containing protein [Aquimarina sp. MMG016]|uniref:sugar-transfer associated ATP-grasp domain-containing protein n=1 Tax=Aquimarina sp. MMG016 TaxID=2822690 RepID=UPI001B3A02CA|nr:sugar-transfer associated ATP-grasp domain-containing protein [Aquimarina sp. MMG016]MBQ4819556.1 hypothetical protein [Aquimarina sp. MMG016]